MAKGDVWTTKDGREIPAVEMTDQHVLHAWCLFAAKRTALALLETAPKGGARILRRTKEKAIDRRLSMLKREIERRGLEVENV